MMKKGTCESLLETTSKEPSYTKPEEAFDNLMLKYFSSKNTFVLIMIYLLIGSNTR